MRLSKIKLAGFKSFVDPTTIPFPSNLTGIVGPNGCGKSNVIDAVRWVMGELSAQKLRGGEALRRGLAGLVLDLILDALEPLLEFNDSLAQAPGHLGQSLPEKEEGDHHDDDQLEAAGSPKRNDLGCRHVNDLPSSMAAVKGGLKVNAVIAPTATEVLGVNDKLQLAELQAAYRRQRSAELMLAGATIVDPTRFDARGPVKVGRDVFIDVNVVLEGSVVLGNRVRIGPNVVIRRSGSTWS